MAIKRKKRRRATPCLKLDPKNRLRFPLSVVLRELGRNDREITIKYNKNQVDFINEAISVLGDYAYTITVNGIVIDIRSKEVNTVMKLQKQEFERRMKLSNEKARQASAYVRKIQSERR